MPSISEIYDITLTAGGGTENLPVTGHYTKYRVTSGAITLTSNWTIQSSGTPTDGTTYYLEYEADVTLSGNSITFFGTTMPSNLSQAKFRVVAVYNESATAWEVAYLLDGNSAGIINTSNIADNAVDLDKLELLNQGSIAVANSSKVMTELLKGSTGQILQANASTIAYVTMSGDATIATGGALTIANDAITTAKILDAQVTNAKLDDMAANTVKVRDANSSGVPSDKALTDTQILINNGSGFTAAPLSKDATMTNAGVVSVTKGTSATASGITQGLIRTQVVDSATLKAKLDGTVNDLFALNAGDTVIECRIHIQTAAGVVGTIDLGPDASLRTAGADPNGYIAAADGNAAANYLSTNDTYTGAVLDFGYHTTDGAGNVTVQSSVNLSTSAIVCSATITYISA